MTEGPQLTMWRVELLHPLFIHFPLALLSIGSVLLLLFVSKTMQIRFPITFSFSRCLIVIGTVGAWLAVATGNWAEEEVNRYLCDPPATHAHGDLATWSTYLFTVVVVLWILERLKFRGYLGAFFQLLSRGTPIVAVVAFGLLVRTAHTGTQLVYLQGAGVYRPSAQCGEFE